MKVSFDADSVNERLARMLVAAFMAPMDPTLDQLTDVKTAVSEAVTNAILHGYEGKEGEVELECRRQEEELWIQIRDYGKGIADVKKAMEPFYTSRPELERSGMGFAFMEAFMNRVEVVSKLGEGTTVYMRKQIGGNVE